VAPAGTFLTTNRASLVAVRVEEKLKPMAISICGTSSRSVSVAAVVTTMGAPGASGAETVKVLCAGVGSTLPVRSRARASKV
jgi:hypothetical protein